MEQKQSAARAYTIAILAATFPFAFVNSVPSILINEIIDTYSLTGASQGLVSSMLSLGVMLALIVTLLLQGRVKKTTMLVLSGLLQAVMLGVAVLAPVFGWFLFAMVLVGIGCGWLDSYVNSCMVDVQGPNSQKYLGILHGLFGVGSLIAPLAAAWILRRADWRVASWAASGVMLLAMALTWGIVRRMPESMNAVTKEKRLSLKDMRDYLKRGRNLLLLICGAMTSMVQTGLLCWIVRYMTLEYQAAQLGAGCLTIYWVAATINRFLAPKLHKKPLVLVVGGAVLSVVFLLIGLSVKNAVVMCVMVGLIGLSTGHFMPMMVEECAQGYEGSTTLTTSVAMLVMSIAKILIPLAMAAVTEAVSPAAGMLLPGIAGALSAIFGLWALKMKTQKA